MDASGSMDGRYPSLHWVCPCGGILLKETEGGSGQSDSTGNYFSYQYSCPKCGAKWLLEVILQFGHEESSWRRLTDA